MLNVKFCLSHREKIVIKILLLSLSNGLSTLAKNDQNKSASQIKAYTKTGVAKIANRKNREKIEITFDV